jgi:hypothetical protein
VVLLAATVPHAQAPVQAAICCRVLRGELSLLLQNTLGHGLHGLALCGHDAQPSHAALPRNVWRLLHGAVPHEYDVLLPSCDVLLPSWT